MTDLVRPDSPEACELEEKRSALALLETELVERELELSTLKQELAVLEAEYLRLVGTLYVDLDELKARTKEVLAAQQAGDWA